MLKVKRLNEDAFLPTKAHEDDAGFDLRIPFDFTLESMWNLGLNPRVSRIETGIAIELEYGLFGLLKERSSLALRGMVISAGVIDNGYRGEIAVICHNISGQDIKFKKGDKIAQLLIMPYSRIINKDVIEVKDVSRTKRGVKGFGSSDLIEELINDANSVHWVCNHCGYSNLAGRLDCFKCGNK